MQAIAEIEAAVGKAFTPSEWFLIDQDRVNHFAEVSLDDAWTHTDPVKAAPLGGTTVQGFLLLALIPHLMHEHLRLPEGCSNGLNYGFDRIRITNMVRVGKRVRIHGRLADFSPYREGWWKKTIELTIEIEGEDKPALRGSWIIVYM